MQLRGSGSYAVIMSLALLVSACGGGGGGGQQNPPQQPQTIAFATGGPVAGGVGTTVTNIASGGAGTGAITYTSSATNVATVNATSGVATLVSTGSTTITATKAASSGFSSATATYQLNVTPGTQTITFAVAGPRNVLLASTSNNAASGGAGTGAITYASNNTNAVTVNATTGAATAVGLGSASITAIKAADANYNAAQTAYVVNVQTADSVHAWVGEQGSEVFLPASANGKQFGRARVTDCAQTAPDLATCTSAATSPVNGASILDARGTLTTPAYYAIVDGTNIGEPVVANTQRFSDRILHGTVFFNDRYWVIGGATPNLPGPPAPNTVHTAQSDIWSSSDGKTWRLETTTPAFGTRWLHKTLVYNNAIWLLGGLRVNGTGANEVWRSPDGVNWTQISSGLPPMLFVPLMTATVFDGSMWIVLNGQTWSSTDGITWSPRSAPTAIDGGGMREYASFTVYNNKLWYIAGAKVVPVSPGPPVEYTRIAVNDVWSSDDGVIWTLVIQNQFSTRQQHAAFVLNNRLWVFGGQGAANAPGPRNDAWSTNDGLTWVPQALSTEIDRSWLAGIVQQPNRVTLIGGILRSYSNKVWQTTNGEGWTELAPFDYSPNLASRGVSFNGAMWVIGGGRLDGLDTDEIWRSTDGLTWSRATPANPTFNPLDSHRMVVFNNRMWVIGGWDFFTSEGGTQKLTNEVWSTADGATWSKHVPSNGVIFSPRAGHEAVVFNGRIWVIGGSDNVTRYNDVWSSADGGTWVLEQQHAAFTPRYMHTVAALNNALWLYAGYDTPNGTTPSVGVQDAWRSTDGRIWTKQATPQFAARAEQAMTVFNGAIILAAGISNDSYFGSTRYNDVWSTTDGVTWQPLRTAAPFSGRMNPILINHNNQLYLIGGFSVSRTHDVWRSNNGSDWSAAFSHPISAP
jgi:hypothetical protein